MLKGYYSGFVGGRTIFSTYSALMSSIHSRDLLLETYTASKSRGKFLSKRPTGVKNMEQLV